MRRLSPLTVLLALLTAGAVVAAVLSLGSRASGTTTPQRTVTVSEGVVQSTVSGSGSLAPLRERAVSFAASGPVTAVDVSVGRHVSEGQRLAQLDPASAEANLAKAQADLQAAQDTLDQVLDPPKKGAKQATQMSEAAARAAVQSAQVAVTQAQHAVEATTLRAPIDGTVVAVDGAVGDTVGGAQGGGGASSTFVKLAQLSRFKMDVSLTESDIGKVKDGQPATVTVNAASGAQFAAKVTGVALLPSSSSSSSASGSDTGAVSYPVTLELTQKGTKLKAGMSASADIVTGEESGLVVPNQALQGSTVTVVRDGKQISRRVTTGLAGDTSTIVLDGLDKGDTVVVRSASAAAGAAAGANGGQQQGQGLGGFGGGRGFGRGFGGGGAGGGRVVVPPPGG